MNKWRETIILAVIIIIGFIGLGIFVRSELREAGRNGPAPESLKKLASTLESKGLWEGAADAYQRYLDEATLSDAERAAVSYHLGVLCLDHLANPAKAAQYLIMARQLAGEEGVGRDADKKIVEALERLGKSLDAQKYLDEATGIESPQKKKPGSEVVVAKVGDHEITMRDLEDEIQMLPPNLQQQMMTSQGKLEFLQGMVAKELMLEAAKREGVENDPEVKRFQERAMAAAIIARYQDREIDRKIRIAEADVRNYYNAHSSEFVKKDEKGREERLSYEQAKESARAKLLDERRRALLDELLNRLQRAQKVEIFSDRIASQ